MLRRYSKCHFSRKICNIPILQQFHLLYHLTSITEKFSTIFCQSNSGSATKKNGNTSLFFRFFDGIGQTWLWYKSNFAASVIEPTSATFKIYFSCWTLISLSFLFLTNLDFTISFLIQILPYFLDSVHLLIPTDRKTLLYLLHCWKLHYSIP